MSRANIELHRRSNDAFNSRWRDGLIVYFQGYVHREDVFRDLGVSEDDVERIDA